MLKSTPHSELRAERDFESQSPFSSINLDTIFRILRRQWPVIAGFTFVALLAAVIFLLTAAPKYTASMTILIDTRKTQLFQTQQVVGDMAIDSSAVESQAEILKSDSTALAVIRNLKLLEDPEYSGEGSFSLIKTITGLFVGPDAPDSQERKERMAVEQFAKALQVKRVGLTYAIDVSFQSLSGEKSARIANAIADAYLVGELDSRYQATLRASRWLQDRMAELRQQATAAETEVQKFKAANNIIDTGRGTISDQQLTDVNTQLTAARAGTAEAKARFDRIQNIAQEKETIPDATVADALRNDVITRLRAQLLDLTAREADWSSRYGVNHTAAVNLRNQMRELRRNMSDELSRIAQTYKSDYEIAMAREQALQDSLRALTDQSNVTSQAQIKLRDLDSTAQSFRNLYDNFLQRFMEATQQQTFPITEARVISAASEPLRKSFPKTLLVVAIALVAGLGLGSGVAFLREQMDNVFREEDQIEQATGIECLGVTPRVEIASTAPSAPADLGQRILRSNIGVNRHVLDAPFSRFTETIRRVKVAIDIASLRRPTRVIGVCSALPQEGKTTIAANLAQQMASSNHRVILVDADLRNPALTRAIASEATEGLVEVITGKRAENEVIWVDPVSGLHVLPAVIDGRISHTADLISSDEMGNLLNRLRDKYEYVVLDFPPVLPVVDVKAASYLVDGFVLVVGWGKTKKDVVMSALSSVDLVSERMIGSVLNGASVAMLRRLEASEGRYYADYHHGYGYRKKA
ncbi:AAA family ATPase [Terrarubrum flagellatum]|uniref:AAA family ATPase n=1 Tax=Terrirubrum flagellatum TaxID=2895980 RepID=UPI003144F800